jgi:ABC-type nitrate/sulfonate/bicarbonate transport system substrate-binding protein
VKALGSKAVDAFWGPEPWGARAEALGVGVRFVQPETIKAIATFQAGLFIYSDKFTREHPKIAREFLAACLKGARYYNEKGLKDPEVLAIVAQAHQCTGGRGEGLVSLLYRSRRAAPSRGPERAPRLLRRP